MTTSEARARIATEPDFVCLRRFRYSLRRLTERYPDGVPNHIIAASLCIDEGEVDTMYERIMDKIRALLKVS